MGIERFCCAGAADTMYTRYSRLGCENYKHQLRSAASGPLTLYTREMIKAASVRKLLTLCLVVQDEQILLGKKKRGFGVDKWNGFGGKVNEGESLEAAACRELEEEAALIAAASDLSKRAVFDFVYGDELIHEVHVYLLSTYTGEAGETEEMLPAWFKFENIPYSEMWEDDKHWLPQVLDGHTVQGSFYFDADKKLIGQKLKVGRLLP